MLSRFGCCGVEGTKRDIISACVTSLHRQMPAVMACHANLGVFTQHVPGFARITVFLAKMHTIRTHPLGKGNAVIYDERNIKIHAKTLNRLCDPRNSMFFHIL